MRTLVQGKGPGPKNVLVEHDDGHRVVYTYREWRKLADNEFAVVLGVVQGGKLAPKEREINNQTVQDVLVKTYKQELVKVTIWPEFDVVLEPGDFVAIDGTFQESEYNGKTYYNLSPWNLAVTKAVAKAERKVVQKTASKTEQSPEKKSSPW